MGLFDIIGAAIRANTPLASGQPHYANLNYNKYQQSGVFSPDDNADFQSLFSLNPDVFRAVSTISNTISQLPWKVTVPTKDGFEDISDSKDLDVFRLYNNRDTHFDFWESTIGYLELNGEVMWLLNYNNKGQVNEMAPLDPNLIKIIPHNEFVVSHYEFNRQGEAIKIPKEFIFHIKYFNPHNKLRGLSPLASAKNDIILDAYALTASKSTFKLGARPSGILSPKGDEELGASEYSRNAQYLKDSYSGAKSFGKLLLLTKGLNFQQLQYSNKDLQYDIIRDATSDQVSKVYGVPHVFMMNFKEASKLANADVQYKILWETLKPKVVKLGQIITEHLLPSITGVPGAKFEFDISKVSALQPDREKMKVLYGDKSAASPNDYREHVLGLERIDNPAMDEYYMPMNLVPVGTQVVQPPAEKDITQQLAEEVDNMLLKQPETTTEMIVKAVTESKDRLLQTEFKAKIDNTFAEINPIRSKVAKKFEKTLAGLIKKQGEAVLRELKNKKHFKFAEGDVLFDFKEWQQKFEEAGKLHLAEAVKLAGEQFALSIGETFNIFSQDAQRYIGTRATEYATIINKTTKMKIDSLLKQGVEEGLSINDMSDKLKTYFKAAEGYRAVRIATTEVNSGVNFGRLESMKQSKRVKKHMWVTMRDSDVRDGHQIDGTSVKLGDNFPGLGADYGGDPRYPSDINERCTTMPVNVKKKVQSEIDKKLGTDTIDAGWFKKLQAEKDGNFVGKMWQKLYSTAQFKADYKAFQEILKQKKLRDIHTRTYREWQDDSVSRFSNFIKSIQSKRTGMPTLYSNKFLDEIESLQKQFSENAANFAKQIAAYGGWSKEKVELTLKLTQEFAVNQMRRYGMNGKITLYRGVNKEFVKLAKLENMKIGESVIANLNSIESWTSNVYSAERFARRRGGYVFAAEFEAKEILFNPFVLRSQEYLSETEFTVSGVVFKAVKLVSKKMG